MGKLVITAPLPDKGIYTAEDYNAFKNNLAAYFNNGEIGNININAADPIDSIKIDFTNATDSHSALHEPGGADEIGDIDILNNGVELASSHTTRQADGGADPLGAKSVSKTMLKSGIADATALLKRKPNNAISAASADVTFDARPIERFDLVTNNVNLKGRAAHRNGKIYWCDNNNEQLLVLNVSTVPMTEGTNIALPVGSNPRDMARIGNDLYVIDDTTLSVLKITDLDTTPVVTTFVGINEGSGAEFTEVFDTSPAEIWITSNGDGTLLFVVGPGVTNDAICRIDVATAAVTHRKGPYTSTLVVGQPYFIKAAKGTVEYIVTIEATGASTTIRAINASDLTQRDSTILPGTMTSARYSWCDGENLIMLNGGSSGSNRIMVVSAAIDPVGFGNVLYFETTGFTEDLVAATNDGNGVYSLWVVGQLDVTNGISLVYIPYWNWSSRQKILLDSDVTLDVGGVAYDDKYVYVWAKKISPGTNARVYRCLL